jgi:hypothetical protein
MSDKRPLTGSKALPIEWEQFLELITCMTRAEGSPAGYGGAGYGQEAADSDPLGYEARELGVTTYDSVTACAITLNYIIGTGCFGLPMAFYQVCAMMLTSKAWQIYQHCFSPFLMWPCSSMCRGG